MYSRGLFDKGMADFTEGVSSKPPLVVVPSGVLGGDKAEGNMRVRDFRKEDKSDA